MDDYKYLSELENISPSNSFLQYISQRVASNDYRGIQCSQHNRLTFEYFSHLISVIYDVAGSDTFCIHVGDDHGILQPQAKMYYEIVNRTKQLTGKGTINSIKKNTFPDIARMGFLHRYDKDGSVILENTSRPHVYSVALSERGIKFANGTAFEKIKLFTDGIDFLTKNTASELVEVLYLNDLGIDRINILEYMYIFSDDRSTISTNDKLQLLLEYRRLSPLEKAKVDTCLKSFCNPLNRKVYNNKTLLRDYNNWKNESQQIYGLFANSTYFKVENDTLVLNTGSCGIFNAQTNRGTKAKSDYFKNHHIQKQNGYELHHIIPFSAAQSKHDAVAVDDYRNLIYLESKKHGEFTKANNRHVLLKQDSTGYILIFLGLSSGDTDAITVRISSDALLSQALVPTLIDYNKQLLTKFYHYSFPL